MTNPTPRKLALLLPLAHRIYAGQVAIGDDIPLVLHTAPMMLAAIQKIEGNPLADPGSPENRGSQLSFRLSIEASVAATVPYNELSNGDVKAFLVGYRDLIKRINGSKPNAGWQAAGFGVGSTRIPTTGGDRITLLIAARAWLAEHPACETTLPRPPAAPVVISAAAALSLAGAMQDAKAVRDAADTVQATALALRDSDQTGLSHEVSGVVHELGEKIPNDDPRYDTFGLNIPAHPSPPLAILALVLIAAGLGKMLAQWSYSTRMAYSRLYLKREGIDTDFINIADAHDLEYTLKDLAPGSVIHVYVVPMNIAGAGPASPTVTATVPL